MSAAPVQTQPIAIVMVALASFIGSFGAVFLKSGAGRLRMELRSLLRNWHLVAGVAAYVVSSIFFVLALRRGELSVLYPMVSLGYAWTLLWSKVFFGEPFTRFKFFGLALIVAGITLMGIGSQK
jgi:multidrug transporter EmrE-like cation transporter